MSLMQTSIVTSPSGAHMSIGGRDILNFGGSSYLGLSCEPALAGAAAEAACEYGGACQLPRHYGFVPEANERAEAAARSFFGVEAAMYFATGYFFGQLALAGLAQDYDVAVLDAHAHYSLRDGAAIAGKPVATFAHQDVKDFARVIAEVTASGKRPLVATDGMFPTFGAVAPLKHYAEILDAYGAWLIVDESHAFGSIGATGQGAIELEGVRGARVIGGGSMAKAFCAHGGLAIGSSAAIERLWTAPAAKGAVAGGSCGAAMTAAALNLVRERPDVLRKLKANRAALRGVLDTLRLHLVDTPSPVATFELSTAEDMKAVQEGLWRRGIFVIYSTYVGAGPNGALRLAAFSDHRAEDFSRLKEALAAELATKGYRV